MANGGIIGPLNIPTSTTATGVWQQDEQYEAKVTDTWPQRTLFTTKSLRFNPGSSDYLNRTLSAGNNKTWTFSAWIKKNSSGSNYPRILGLYIDANDYLRLNFNREADGEQLHLYYEVSGTASTLLTNRLFRDFSAWYHIVVSVNTTLGTADDRLKIYVNGVQETSFATRTNPSQDSTTPLNNNGDVLLIGKKEGASSDYYNGYMSEVILVDGQALDPTSFGVANSDGVWTPIPYTGTFGTNGFNLQFENSAALGTDSSPNGNTFTVNNLTSIDQSTDYPEVNFTTWNPLANFNNTLTFSEGNLKGIANSSSNPWFSARANIGFTSGKWFWETKFTGSTDPVPAYIGVVDESAALNINDAHNANGNTLYYNGSGGEMRVDGSSTSNDYGNFSTSDICGVAVNADDNLITIYKNGSAIITNYALSTTRTGFLFPTAAATNTSSGTNSNGLITNFGSPPFAISSGNTDGNGYGNFEYAVPSGYYALNTANLAEFG